MTTNPDGTLTAWHVYRTNDESSYRTTVLALDEKGWWNVTVWQGIEFRNLTWEDALVSWPSFGALPPDVAERFSAMMAEAVRIAREWTAERSGKKVDA